MSVLGGRDVKFYSGKSRNFYLANKLNYTNVRDKIVTLLNAYFNKHD